MHQRPCPSPAPAGAKTEAARLALELAEARERQAATAEVLSLIADAPTDLLPVFDRIVRNAARLCQSVLSAVYRREGEHVHLVAHDQFSPELVAAVQKAYPAPLTSQNLISVAIRERRVVHEPDVLVSGGYSELQRTSGYRSILIVPMLRDEVAIGAIAVMRLEPQLFPKAQVELLKTFAGQAVIAIENTRLFTELQQRSRQLSQSLEDLRAAQDSLVQTEKLAALGRLVAGVAHEINTPVGTSLTVASAFINKTKRFEADVASGDVRRSTLTEFIAASREAASQIMFNLGNAVDLIQSFKQVAADRNVSDRRRFDLGRGDRTGCQGTSVRAARPKSDGQRRMRTRSRHEQLSRTLRPGAHQPRSQFRGACLSGRRTGIGPYCGAGVGQGQC